MLLFGLISHWPVGDEVADDSHHHGEHDNRHDSPERVLPLLAQRFVNGTLKNKVLKNAVSAASFSCGHAGPGRRVRTYLGKRSWLPRSSARACRSESERSRRARWRGL